MLRKIVKKLIIFTVLISVILITYEQLSRVYYESTITPGGELVDVGGYNLHYLQMGYGSPTVIFESGVDPRSHLQWFDIQSKLSQSVTTISYDRAGYLFSDSSTKEKNIINISNDLEVMLEKIDAPKPYILVGHSIAGVTLRPFIENNINYIKGVVFLDVAHPNYFTDLPSELSILAEENSNFLNFLGKIASFLGLFRIISGNATPDLALHHHSLNAWIDEYEYTEKMLIDAREFSDFEDINLAVIAGNSKSKCKQLVNNKALFKKCENYLDLLQNDLINLSSKARLIKAIKSRHYIHFEQPELVIDEINRMISL